MVEQWPARRAHNPEVAGSNPAHATNSKLNIMEKLEKLLNVKIVEDWDRHAELQIYSQTTADGYEMYIMTNDADNLYWEDDVYYYEPSFDDIIDRIKDIQTNDDEPAIIYCSDIEQFFNEYDVNDYVEQYENDDEE